MGWPGPVTARQWQAWVAWKIHCDVQLAPPSLTDYQLMRVAQRVQQVLSRSPNQITLQMQRVEFEGGRQDQPEPSAEQASAWSQARWLPMAKQAKGFKFTPGPTTLARQQQDNGRSLEADGHE